MKRQEGRDDRRGKDKWTKEDKDEEEYDADERHNNDGIPTMTTVSEAPKVWQVRLPLRQLRMQFEAERLHGNNCMYANRQSTVGLL